MKRDVTWRLKESGRTGPFWQKRFYDHVIRDADYFARHLDYVHYNPVKHQQASRPTEHGWSSFQEWVKGALIPNIGAQSSQIISRPWTWSRSASHVDITFLLWAGRFHLNRELT
jgi:putative transposase